MTKQEDSTSTDNISRIIDAELSEISNNIESFYWVPLIKTPFEPLNRVCSDIDTECKALAISFKSFTANLEAAEKMLLLPYMLVSQRAVDKAIETRGLKIIEHYGDSEDENRKRLVDFTKIVLKYSGESLSKEKDELKYMMYQACILIWSALETYCKDVFISTLNQRPQLYQKILKDPFLKDNLSISQSSWEKLMDEHSYDLNGKLGNIIAGNKDFSSPKLLQRLFCCLFDESVEHLDYFKSNDLWILGQRRHLIAHRCGIVDKEYLAKINDNEQIIGNQLRLKGRDIASGLAISAQCAIVLYGAAMHLWNPVDNIIKTG